MPKDLVAVYTSRQQQLLGQVDSARSIALRDRLHQLLGASEMAMKALPNLAASAKLVAALQKRAEHIRSSEMEMATEELAKANLELESLQNTGTDDDVAVLARNRLATVTARGRANFALNSHWVTSQHISLIMLTIQLWEEQLLHLFEWKNREAFIAGMQLLMETLASHTIGVIFEVPNLIGRMMSLRKELLTITDDQLYWIERNIEAAMLCADGIGQFSAAVEKWASEPLPVFSANVTPDAVEAANGERK